VKREKGLSKKPIERKKDTVVGGMARNTTLTTMKPSTDRLTDVKKKHTSNRLSYIETPVKKVPGYWLRP